LRDLQVGNRVRSWSAERADIKHAFEHTLTGPEIRAWWPGVAALGACDDREDGTRGCWYRAKVLDGPDCRAEDHCLHIAMHDGEPSHTYTCPTWLRGQSDVNFSLPGSWQACPVRFKVSRWETGVPSEFRAAIRHRCAAASLDHCLGPLPDEARGDAQFVFDLRHNRWYWCTTKMRCEPYDVSRITHPVRGYCGRCPCDVGHQCLEHISKTVGGDERIFHHCVRDANVIVVSDGDDVKNSSGVVLATVGPPPESCKSRIGCFL